MTKLASGLGEPKRKVPKTSKHVVNMLSQREVCKIKIFNYLFDWFKYFFFNSNDYF